MTEAATPLRVFVAGHKGLVGQALCRRLAVESGVDIVTRSRIELDLLDQTAVRGFFATEAIDQVYLAAARVGGIGANSERPAEFIYENLVIETNVFDAAYKSGVQKLCMLGSSCIYPKLAPQPIREDSLLTGPLEATNAPYAIAKIAGIQMAQAYSKQYGFKAVCPMPTNLYGPGDNFDLQSSHVLPALLRKFHEAKTTKANQVEIWGSGTPFREFLHADDMADACIFLMDTFDSAEVINVGTGKDISIGDLARLIAEVVGFEGELTFDTTKPDGTPRKLLDVTRLQALGWQPRIGLREGIEQTYRWYIEHGPDSA